MLDSAVFTQSFEQIGSFSKNETLWFIAKLVILCMIIYACFDVWKAGLIRKKMYLDDLNKALHDQISTSKTDLLKTNQTQHEVMTKKVDEIKEIASKCLIYL